jgi:hypothetical protein
MRITAAQPLHSGLQEVARRCANSAGGGIAADERFLPRVVSNEVTKKRLHLQRVVVTCRAPQPLYVRRLREVTVRVSCARKLRAQAVRVGAAHGDTLQSEESLLTPQRHVVLFAVPLYDESLKVSSENRHQTAQTPICAKQTAPARRPYARAAEEPLLEQ